MALSLVHLQRTWDCSATQQSLRKVWMPREPGQLQVKFLIYFSAEVQESGYNKSALNPPIHLHLGSCALEPMENIQLKDLSVVLASPPSKSHVDRWLQSIMRIPSPGIIRWLSAVAPIVIANAYSSELFLLALSHRPVLKVQNYISTAPCQVKGRGSPTECFWQANL